MKSLIKLTLMLFLGFAALMLAFRLSGLWSFAMIETWIETLRGIPPLYIGAVVAALLVVDLFLSVPTLALTMLAGFMLGHVGGAVSALTGLLLAGIAGYGLGRAAGARLLPFLIRDELERRAARQAFRSNGFVMIMLARAVPMLPEVTSCLAGMLRMRFGKFLLALLLGSGPYVWIAAYAGSVSSLDEPRPAIMAAMGISGFLWLSWFLHHRLQKRRIGRRP